MWWWGGRVETTTTWRSLLLPPRKVCLSNTNHWTFSSVLGRPVQVKGSYVSTSWSTCLLWVREQYLSAVPPSGRVWHKTFFLRWVRAQSRSPDASGIPLKKGHLRRQTITLTPPRRVKAGSGPLRLNVYPETWHTWPDPFCWHHGQPKCVPSTGFCWMFVILIVLYRWFNKGIPQVQAEELASLSESG